MPSSSYLRGEPCTACGAPVAVIETTNAAMRAGRRLALPPQIRYRHVYVETMGDRVDEQCSYATARPA